MADQSLLALHINKSKVFYELDFTSRCHKLPISYLKFLMFINNQPQLTQSQYWSFFMNAPLLTFDFIERYPTNQLTDIWHKIFHNLFLFSEFEVNYQIFYYHLNIFYCFLQSSLIHPDLLTPLLTSSFIQRLLNTLFSKATITFSDQKWSALLILLIFCRVDNRVSKELSISVQFHECLRNIVLNDSENPNLYQKFDLIMKYFFWVLNPESEFPIQGMMPLYAQDVFQNLSLPSSIFSKKIFPFLISLLIRKAFSGCLNKPEIDKFISKLQKLWEVSKDDHLQHNLLLGQINEEALMQIFSYAMTNSPCFDLLCKILSFSCNFTLFSKVYNTLFDDHRKLLQFLTLLAKQAPVVNDFTRITSHFELKTNCMGKTVAMWIRITKQPARIATFRIGEEMSVVVKFQMNTFIFDVDQKRIKFITSNSIIEGWHFVCISLAPDSITASVNLTRIKIEYDFDSDAFLTLGENKAAFDLQSVRIFHSILSERQINYLFFLGPNFKELIFDNLSCVDLKEKAFLYATSEGYISTFYSDFTSRIKYIKDVYYINLGLEYIISPPFILSDDTFSNSEINLADDRFHLQSFFNCLEGFGGFSLLIHFLAEIILKEKELHEAAFELIFILINKFPFVHHYFEKNKFYQIIGQLLTKSSEKVDSKLILKCAIMNINESSNSTFSNVIILNSNVLKYWLLTPSIFYQNAYEIIERIFDSLQSDYKDYNLSIIIHSPIFSFISNSFLNSKSYTNKLFELLISLGLQITTEESVKENIDTIIQCILECHLNPNSKEEIIANSTIKDEYFENIEQPTIFLLHLLVQIFIKFPESVAESSIEDLFPLFVSATNNVKVHIFEILMKYLNQDFYSDFISALTHSNSNRQFLEKIFQISFKFINIADNMKTNNFHYITIPLLYFINQIETAEDLLVSFCTGLTVILQNIPKYPEMMLDHFYLSLRMLKKKPEMIEKHLEPKFEHSFTRIPQVLFMYITFVQNAIFKGNSETNNVRMFLICLSKVDYGQYSIFILSSVINDFNRNKKNSEINELIERFVEFSLLYLNFIINLRKDVSITSPPPHIQLLIVSSTQFCHKSKNKRLSNLLFFVLSEIESTFPEVYSSIENEVKNYKSLLKRPKAAKSPLTTSSDEFTKFLSIKEMNDKNNIQKVKSARPLFRRILDEQESNDGIIESWKFIFDSLHFPDSLIHANCPEKYKIDEFSKKYQIHRLLFPTNPAYEYIYSDKWSEKYIEPQPTVKLTMEDVIHDVGISYSKSVKFSEKIHFLYGVRAIDGFLTVKEKYLRFFFPLKCDEIIFNVRNISKIFLNEFLHQPSGFAIEDKNENLFSFAFKSSSIRDTFIQCTKKLFAKYKIKIISKYSFSDLRRLTNQWENGLLSNFEYLINLNFISGRSWSDFTRYPFFPWVFSGINKAGDEEGQKSSSEKETIKFDSNQVSEGKPAKAEREASTSGLMANRPDSDTILRETHSKSVDYQLPPIHSVESIDISEIDASTASTSEETKVTQLPLLPLVCRTQLKSAKSSPSVPLSPTKSSSILTSFVTSPSSSFSIPLHFSSSTASSHHLILNRANSISEILSDSRYKLDIPQTFQNNVQINDQPTLKISSFNDLYLIKSKSQYQIRSLCLPFFAQTQRQQESCIKYFHLTEMVENDPHHYSSYMSNISSALYFLIRLEPSTTFEIDHQDGKLDAADRTFQSLELTLQVMSNPDSRSAIELVPELFFMPEIMLNVNKINFPISPIHKRVINDVFIPSWAKNAHKYVRYLRMVLESEKNSMTLNSWIDMVWGVKREGKLAIEKFNTFQKIVFEFNPSQFSDNPKMMNAFKTQIINCGQAPFRLFSVFHPHRKFQPIKRKLSFSQIYEQSFEFNSFDSQKSSIQSSLRFADEIEVSIYVQKNNEFIFGHKNVPIISFWNVFEMGPNNNSKNKMEIEFKSIMRGHLAELTALDLSTNRFVAAGHADGKLSTFCLIYHSHFLRTIECPLKSPISLVKVLNDNSAIIAFQNNGVSQCLASLFSSNGSFIEKLEIDDYIIDCVLSSFFDGIQTNYAFALTKSGIILALSMNSLKIKYKFNTMRNDIVSLSLNNNYILCAVTNSNIVLSWQLF